MPYNSHMPIQQSKNLYGVKGWLKFFVILMFLTGCVYFYYAAKAVFILEQFGFDFSYLYGFLSLLFFSIIFSVACLSLVYLIYRRRETAPKYAKIFLIVQPFISSIWVSLLLFQSFPSPQEEVFYIFFGVIIIVFSISIGFNIPWIIYFNESVRVQNTFYFFGELLPSSIQCPECSEILELDEDERRNKPIICASCGKAVSKESVLSSAVENEQTQGV